MSSVRIEINGVRYGGFETISITKSLDALCGKFVFTTSADELSKFPLKQNDKCKIYVDGETIIVGFIERFEVDYDDSSHTISVSGRDRTSDIKDSSFGKELNFTPPTTLKKVCDGVLALLGNTEIKTVVDSGIAKFGKNDVLMAGEIGTNAFHFLETYARLRETILTTNSDGNLLLTKSSKKTINTILVNKRNGLGNNIKSANFISDISRRFYKYAFYSTDNISALVLPGSVAKKPQDVVNNNQVYIDSKIRATRLFSKKKERNSGNKTTIKNRAQWEARIREVRGFAYRVVVQGFTAINDNLTWKPNMLVHIEDELALLYGDFLINSVQYDLSEDEGSLTTLNFVKKNAYDLQLQLEGGSSSDAPWEL